MSRPLPAVLFFMLTAAAAAAQTESPTPPRVLSTVPSPPDGTISVPAEMSGRPLQVGDLPPGIVSVRVIRVSFQNNVPDQTVQLRVEGSDRVLAAVTRSDGRAQFDGLTVGDVVRVRTGLDGELLESQPFPIPSAGGVRLVLVAGAGAAVADADPWPGALATDSATSAGHAVMPSPSAQSPGARSTALTYIAFGAVVSVVTGAVVFGPRAIGRKSKAAATPATVTVAAQPAARRSEVFDELVQLERDYEMGRLAADLHAVRREALIEELLSFDAPPERPA